MEEIFEKIGTAVAGYREEITAELCRLVSVPSVSGTPAVGEALSFCEDLFLRNGYGVEGKEENLFLSCRKPGDGKALGVFTHCDVVPADEGDWKLTKPFSPLVYRDCVVGRGTSDDKAGILIALYAEKALKDAGYPLRSSYGVFVGGNEETGMSCLSAYLASRPALPDVSFVPDSSMPLSLGEKSIVRFTVKTGKLSKIKDFSGGAAENVVPANAGATVPFLPARSTPEHVTVKASEGGYRITASGTAYHASTPGKGRSAIALLADYLSSCEELPEGDRAAMREIAFLQKDFFPSAVGRRHATAEFGEDTFVIGTAKTAEGVVRFTVDCRLDPRTDEEDFIRAVVTALAERGFSAVCHEKSRGFLIEKDALTERLLAAYERTAGEGKGKPYYTYGGTYSRRLPRAYSVGVSCPPCRVLDLGDGHGGEHQSDEYIPIAGLLDAVRVVAGYLYTADRYLHGET